MGIRANARLAVSHAAEGYREGMLTECLAGPRPGSSRGIRGPVALARLRHSAHPPRHTCPPHAPHIAHNVCPSPLPSHSLPPPIPCLPTGPATQPARRANSGEEASVCNQYPTLKHEHVDEMTSEASPVNWRRTPYVISAFPDGKRSGGGETWGGAIRILRGHSSPSPPPK